MLTLLKQLLCKHQWRHHMYAFTQGTTYSAMLVQCGKCELTGQTHV